MSLETWVIFIASGAIFLVPILFARAVFRRSCFRIRKELGSIEVAEKQIQLDLQEVDPSSMKLKLHDDQITALRYVGDTAGESGNDTLAAEIVQHLIRSAKSMQRESLLACQVYVQRLDSHRLKLRVWPQIAQRFGILGTFVGLVLGLYRLSSDIGTQINQLELVMGSMSTAFLTSIAGLLAWFFTQYYVGQIDKKTETLSQKLTSLWINLDEMLVFARFQGVLPASVERLTGQVKAMDSQLRQHGVAVREEVDRVLLNAHNRDDALHKTLTGFEKNQQHLDELSLAHRQSIDQISAVFQTALGYEQRLGQSILHELKAHTHSTLEGAQAENQKAIEKLIHSLTAQTKLMTEGLGEQVQGLGIYLENRQNEEAQLATKNAAKTMMQSSEQLIRIARMEMEQLLQAQATTLQEQQEAQWQRLEVIIKHQQNTKQNQFQPKSPLRMLVGSTALTLLFLLGMLSFLVLLAAFDVTPSVVM